MNGTLRHWLGLGLDPRATGPDAHVANVSAAASSGRRVVESAGDLDTTVELERGARVGPAVHMD